MQATQNIEHQSSPLASGDGGCEAIILAGGFGTRLRPVVADLPKCMAPVAGKPFLHYVIKHLQKQGVDKFIFSLGYLSETIEAFLSINYPSLNYQLSIETEPLDTGGAIQLACKKAIAQNVLALNGDTLFLVDVNTMMQFHEANKAACTLSLKPMQQLSRYGMVEMDNNNCITSFKEKQFYQNGLINGGVYIINKEKFLSKALPEKFSFEKDYLEKMQNEQHFFGLQQDAYFIDIGIPEDFERAQIEFVNMQL